ncbi:LppP/LprE lipoprotein [Streptoalloteichus tenebrarius]|uniref:LppP/LprE lipoprotein n=1 Tax=Streptoalloteichus tenebrarius (strain ATCC 17920 / DSM 40477 / JCM 4838 / CBS 697.72 / NBRC 16177 / NCIMB 11028 / NRRL B-12390 / A12253. 1 / ISP 5477) TaxID=1933 RepID=A0ABT1HXR9_STRSD|nr:LppP/LprE family lipoprotein [Streptoalloteichus tenebrarius]MCP2260321.1 LppP/LprE lipoprotein [Streptoalloteichus tenebrarius]BFF03071.1 hypothetical protein GCM10020241_47460 [Streptoalloteichus tenebrarius]
MRRALAVLVVVPLVLAVGACGRRPALQVEGSAPSVTARPVTSTTSVPPPRPSNPDNIREVDLRGALLADPQVSPYVKKTLSRCGDCGLQQPSYVDLTRDGREDVVVQVVSGAENDTERDAETAYYVYSVQNGELRQIFGVTGTSAMEVWPDNGDLMLWRALFAPGDPYCCPSGEETVRYSWDGRRLVEVRRYPEHRAPTSVRPTPVPKPKESR